MSTINFKKLKDYVFYSFILLSILFALIPFIFLETYEMSLSMKIVFDNIVLFGLFSVVLSIIFYDNVFLSTKTKNKISYIIIRGFKIIFGSSLMFILIFGLISGVLLSVNSYVGNQEIIKVKSKVISIKETNSKSGKNHYYIIVEIPDEKREVELNVNRQYYIGEIFDGQLHKGSLNMYYRKK